MEKIGFLGDLNRLPDRAWVYYSETEYTGPEKLRGRSAIYLVLSIRKGWKKTARQCQTLLCQQNGQIVLETDAI